LAPGRAEHEHPRAGHVVDFDELEQVIWGNAPKIRKRDGGRVANEVRRRLADSITAMSTPIHGRGALPDH
jgi:hypothetical protein